MKAVLIQVIGKVQGVAFRYYTKKQADNLSLSGTVQNLEDGSVIIHAKGTEKDITKLIDWCNDVGSPASSVTEVKIEHIDHNSLQDFDDFSIIR